MIIDMIALRQVLEKEIGGCNYCEISKKTEKNRLNKGLDQAV
jgi:Fe-S cluster biogenesis protein NfuA